MTREEKLDWLYRLRSEIWVYMPKEWLIPMNEALDYAIKVLEQEPCDCISRQEVLDKIKEVCFSKEQEWVDFRVSQGSNGQRNLIIKFIESLPSIQLRPIEGDAISREKAIKHFSRWWSDMLENHEQKEDFVDILKALPSVQPNTDVLGKIRAEIKGNRDEWIEGQDTEWNVYDRCLRIIDKYKAESEK